ncbi:hypothetical protein AB0A95_17685 [Micromonospora sp. NPDC049230]
MLDAKGLATAKRELYVIKSGLRSASAPVVIGKPGRKERVSRRVRA